MNYVVMAFYKFVTLADHEALREPLLQQMALCNIKGTIILAREGINGSFSGIAQDVSNFINFLSNFPQFRDLTYKENLSEFNPFDKAKVKLRPEIVSLGIDEIDAENATGIHVKPEEWNALISDGNVLTIDTRNAYEVALGSFKGAVDPQTLNFRDFPDYVEKHLSAHKDKKIAMFCTGGIRCEKSTAYLKKLGFSQVYQLEGGILNYLESIPADQSLWQGSCFVFDNRIAVDESLASVQEGSIDLEWKNKFREQALNESDS